MPCDLDLGDNSVRMAGATLLARHSRDKNRPHREQALQARSSIGGLPW